MRWEVRWADRVNWNYDAVRNLRNSSLAPFFLTYIRDQEQEDERYDQMKLGV